MAYPKFPAGELAIKNTTPMTRYWELKTSDDFMALILSADAELRAGRPLPVITIGYFNYSRQDRVCHKGEPFSLQVVCKILNQIGFPQIEILEPHSLVLPALLEKSKTLNMEAYLGELTKGKIIIAPDAGAEKRAYRVAKKYGNEVVIALKERSSITGEILRTTVLCDSLKGKDCLMVDDICDGGATFVNLAIELKKKGAAKISLLVAHGLFTKGLTVFNGLIDEVYSINKFEVIRHK